jgi:tRNA A-37 threonylcarbamoyl transferase component Bud32
VVAARAVAHPVFGWRLELVTRRVEDALDLGQVLTLLLTGELARAPRAALCEAFGDLVRRLHLHGFLHADLQPANVLVQRQALEGARPVLTVLDLDRSAFHAELSGPARRANLRRLYRHVERRTRRAGRQPARTDVARFMRGYDPERARWKDDWRAVAGGHALGLVWHRVGWALERLFSRTRPREAQEVIRPQRR